MPENKNLPSSVYTIAWNELYKLYGERLDQENLDIMDAVLGGVNVDMDNEIERFERETLRRFPHLGKPEFDDEKI